MTTWNREFIAGRIVYVIQPETNDYLGASQLVMQLLPTLLTGEEIRVRPPVAPHDQGPPLPWGARHGSSLNADQIETGFSA